MKLTCVTASAGPRPDRTHSEGSVGQITPVSCLQIGEATKLTTGVLSSAHTFSFINIYCRHRARAKGTERYVESEVGLGSETRTVMDLEHRRE